MSIYISQKCEVPGCEIPRQKHTPKQRARCSRIRQQMRESGLLKDEKIVTPVPVYRITPATLSCKRYTE